MTDKGMDFFQAKCPFLGVMCIPTVAIATKNSFYLFNDIMLNVIWFQFLSINTFSRHFYHYVYSFKSSLFLSLNNILLSALKERIKTCSNSFQALGMLNGRDLQKKINLLRFWKAIRKIYPKSQEHPFKQIKQKLE